jgi:ethanolamine ammonia-lyase large subunit
MPYSHTLGGQVWQFADLATLMARATPLRSGDVLAGVAARTMTERMAARMALAELPLKVFLSEALVPYEVDEVTRLIVDSHDAATFAEIAHLTVGDFRDWLLLDATDEATLARVRRGITPEMAAAVSKLMRNQDLIRVARKCRLTSSPP